MDDDTTERILREINERIVRLQRELGSIVPKLPGGDVADCNCLQDLGCCSDKGCCQDKGCCKQQAPDNWWDEIIDFGDRLGIPVEDLVARIRALDPKLLGAHS